MSDKTQQRNPGQTSGMTGQDMSGTQLLAIIDPNSRAFSNLPGQQIPGAMWSQAATLSGEDVVIAGFASKTAYAPLERDPSLNVKDLIEFQPQSSSQRLSQHTSSPTRQD